jgi:hypothetical protein
MKKIKFRRLDSDKWETAYGQRDFELKRNGDAVEIKPKPWFIRLYRKFFPFKTVEINFPIINNITIYERKLNKGDYPKFIIDNGREILVPVFHLESPTHLLKCLCEVAICQAIENNCRGINIAIIKDSESGLVGILANTLSDPILVDNETT